MNVRSIYHTLLLLLCIASSVSGQTDSSWKKIGTVDGRITQIEFHPSGAWFLIARRNGPLPKGVVAERPYLYRSTDEGRNWTQIGDSLFVWPYKERGRILCVHPSGAILVTAGNSRALLNREKRKDHGIYRSIDGGETWTKVNGGIPNGLELLHDGAVITRPTSGLKCLSTDGGLTWVDFTLPGFSECADPDGDGESQISVGGSLSSVLFLTCSHSRKVWRSTDRGISWLESISDGYLPHMTSGGTPVFTKSVLRNPPKPSLISTSDSSRRLFGDHSPLSPEGHAEFWVSNDHGSYWHRSDTAYQSINWRYTKLMNGHDNVLYSLLEYLSGKFFVLQKSTDLGNSWTTISETFPRSGGFTSFALHPDGRFVLGTLNGEIYALREN